jgi:hypothetical protein
MEITSDALYGAARKLAKSGDTLYTLSQLKPFTIRSEAGKYYWVISTQNERLIHEATTERVLERYRETRSVSPGDYQDVTFNSSYYCALMSAMQKGEV